LIPPATFASSPPRSRAPSNRLPDFCVFRVRQNPLDNTSVHPESYAKVKALATLLKVPVSPELAKRAQGLDLEQLSGQLGLGTYTLADILDALARPGRDPRDDLPQPELDQEILDIKDLTPGMVIRGVCAMSPTLVLLSISVCT